MPRDGSATSNQFEKSQSNGSLWPALCLPHVYTWYEATWPEVFGHLSITATGGYLNGHLSAALTAFKLPQDFIDFVRTKGEFITITAIIIIIIVLLIIIVVVVLEVNG